jgi:putative endonuclease
MDTRRSPSQQQGHEAEQQARAHLQRRGLKLVEANYRCRGGEIDLVMRDGATLVFVEVRQRSSASHGGAVASIHGEKKRRLVCAARTYLLRFADPPPCRFDVVAVDGAALDWLSNVIDE